MENYRLIELVGEGSFGRVYKAQSLKTEEFVAYKVIVKTGRSDKELKGLRQECEIQQHLHHPNIVHMIDSFETENEIVVVTEFVDRQLYQILGREGYLPEEEVRKIVCDLVSALYYLHSHRVLHRDLKPQNVLIDKSGTAKLCDFGFARNMGTGTHVLTSIKGTPLYMAPELIEERPYDYRADLWSLGCIVYELLVGSPPFSTSSLLQLVRLVQHEAIQWPHFITPNCKDFLQGLLHKDADKRLSWLTGLQQHPFLQNGVYVELEEEACSLKNPFTCDLSASQILAKENQKQRILRKNSSQHRVPNMYEMNVYNMTYNTPPQCYYHQPYLVVPVPRKQCAPTEGYKIPGQPNQVVKNQYDDFQPILAGANNANVVKTSSCPSQSMINISLTDNETRKVFHSSLKSMTRSADLSNNRKLFNSVASQMNDLKISHAKKKIESKLENKTDNEISKEALDKTEVVKKPEMCKKVSAGKSRALFTLHSWDSAASARPIENDEWMVFLQRNMEEVMMGQLDCLRNCNLVSVVVTPLRNANASCRVLEYVASLLSLPFVVDGPSDKDLDNIRQVYLEVKVVPNLVYASKIIARSKGFDSESSSPSLQTGSEVLLRPVSELRTDELQALECIFLLICHLVHSANDFLIQFCDAAAILNAVSLLRQFLLLGRRKVRAVSDLLAILNLVLRVLPENADVIEQIVLGPTPSESNSIELGRLLSHSSGIIRSRTCELIKLLSVYCGRSVQAAWNAHLQQDLNALLSDSITSVKLAAEDAVAELKSINETKIPD